MAKGIIVLEEIPRSCIECPMCYHATDISIGKFQYERLYKCKLEPEDIEQVYLEDILHKKPDWCPIKEMPSRKQVPGCFFMMDEVYGKEIGFNDCLDEIFGRGK